MRPNPREKADGLPEVIIYLNFAKQSYKSEFDREARQLSNVAISDAERCAIDVVDKRSEVIDIDW
jgi:hypothetical protein